MIKNKFGLKQEEMIQAGMHLGHYASKLHPKMKDFILGVKSTSHIIDLEKTIQYFEDALKFIEKTIQEGGVLLLVSTKVPLRHLIKSFAEEMGLPYIIERWPGGIFTNFKIVSQRMKYLRELEEKTKKGLSIYTKKERVKFNKELQALRRKFEGIKNMKNLPAAVFICDLNKDMACFKEAKLSGIKVVSIIDTDTDISGVDYPIPANDDAINSIKYILEKIKEVVLKAKLSVPKKEEIEKQTEK